MTRRIKPYFAASLVFVGCSTPPSAPTAPAVTEPSPTVSADLPFGATRVVAYSYDACIPSDGDWCSGPAMSFALNGAFVDRKNVKAVPLGPEQAALVVGWLRRPATYGGGEGKCYFPHHSLGFYDGKDQLVGEVSICLACNHLKTSSAVEGIPVHTQEVQDGESLDLMGFSEVGVSEFIALCSGIGLQHCDADNPFEVD